MTKRPPRVGFVSLGCPKALVDSERIVTELRAEGYLISSTYKDSDLVIVRTLAALLMPQFRSPWKPFQRP